MTNVRSREECLNAIQADSAWRKKEIATLKKRLNAHDDGDKGALLRSSVVMVYAHWEGFVKTACELYLAHINEMISRRSIQPSKHFTNLLMWKMLRKKGDHTVVKNPVPFLQMCDEWPCSPGELLPLDIVNMESNLNSDVLKKITAIIDVDYSYFESKIHLIDDSLLKIRNDIAHGARI